MLRLVRRERLKTLAAILVEQKAPLVVDEVEVPEPTFGQVLVRVLRSGVCGSQLGELDGKKGPDKWLPHLLGHEATGVVEQVGPHVTQVKPGDRVVLHWRPGAGVQAPTASYGWRGKKVNAGWVTTFQERTVVSENRVTKVPAELDPESGVLYGCALTTAFGCLANDARLKPGESVVVLGAGGVGLAVVLAAHLTGAHPIVAVDLQAHKLEAARRYGATQVYTSADAVALDGGADVVIENTGVPSVMSTAYRLAGPQGRVVLVGVPDAGHALSIDTMPLHFGKVLTGSHGGEADPAYDIPRLVRLQLAGRFDPAGMISHRFPLAQVNDAIAAMRSGEAIRCVLVMDGA